MTGTLGPDLQAHRRGIGTHRRHVEGFRGRSVGPVGRAASPRPAPRPRRRPSPRCSGSERRPVGFQPLREQGFMDAGAWCSQRPLDIHGGGSPSPPDHVAGSADAARTRLRARNSPPALAAHRAGHGARRRPGPRFRGPSRTAALGGPPRRRLFSRGQRGHGPPPASAGDARSVATEAVGWHLGGIPASGNLDGRESLPRGHQ